MNVSEQQTIKFISVLKDLYCKSHGIDCTLTITDSKTGEVKYQDRKDNEMTINRN